MFYVALTRAKEKTFIITDSANKSKFIKELEVEDRRSVVKKCPICKSADLILLKESTTKTGEPYYFYRCSNEEYGCEYKAIEFSDGTKKNLENALSERI